MTIGSLVTEAETDPNWQMYPGETGEIIASADEEMGLPGCGRFWTVCFGPGSGSSAADSSTMVFLDTDLVVVS